MELAPRGRNRAALVAPNLNHLDFVNLMTIRTQNAHLIKLKGITMKFKISIRFLFVAIILGCTSLVLILGISNLTLDTTLENPSQLSREDKIILQETKNLVDTLGSSVFPGFGEAKIPTILYNSNYAFLAGSSDPADGWVKVPQGTIRGTAWEPVLDETLLDTPIYFQPLPDQNITPEAFTVRVGDEWVTSMQTYEWMRISLVEVIQADLPSLIKPIFPYRFFTNQLVNGQDQYISLIVHERLHSYQGILAEGKFSQAELTNHEFQDQYPWQNEPLEDAWKAELILLSDALKADNLETMNMLAKEFLTMREARRKQAGLTPELIALEQQREWLEGLARYAELKIWKLASTATYTPIPETAQLLDFDDYQKFNSRWKAELNQFSQMANDVGDGRFYYSGMAQAYLLDQLMPDWKTQIFEEGVWLEELLAEAVQ
ncbi:MAG TPA: hypothetical protein VJ965_06570 [Anaerolineales bacterium]|nr:hypothetical protein [Anaerolineales bacterium]